MTDKTKLNSLEEMKLALEHHQFADILAASAEIQSRLVVKRPLTEPDCALLAGAFFARAAALVCCGEYCDGLFTAQRAIRAMCVLGPETELIDMIFKTVGADLKDLEDLAEASESVEEWLSSTSLDAGKRPGFCKLSLAALKRCEPLQRAMTIALMRDLVELVEEWARVSAERTRLDQDGGEPNRHQTRPLRHRRRVCSAQHRTARGTQPRRYDR